MSMKTRLKHLGLIPLPPPFPPVGEYLQVMVVGRWMFISGAGPWPNGPPPDNEPIKGTLGLDTTVEEGKRAAYEVARGVLRTIDDHVGLENVLRLVKVNGYVKAIAPSTAMESVVEFKETHKVMNGFSTVMIDVFGPRRGKGIRTAIGVPATPFGIAVEADCILYLRRFWRIRRFLHWLFGHSLAQRFLIALFRPEQF